MIYDTGLTADLEYPLVNPDEDGTRKGRALTIDEINALLEALPYYIRPLVQIMALTGATYWRGTGHAVEVLP